MGDYDIPCYNVLDTGYHSNIIQCNCNLKSGTYTRAYNVKKSEEERLGGPELSYGPLLMTIDDNRHDRVLVHNITQHRLDVLQSKRTHGGDHDILSATGHGQSRRSGTYNGREP